MASTTTGHDEFGVGESEPAHERTHLAGHSRELKRASLLGLISYQPGVSYRAVAVMKVSVLIPVYAVLGVQSAKQIEIEGILNEVTNSTAATVADVAAAAQRIAGILASNITNTSPLIDGRVVAADFFQVVFATIGLFTFGYHRLQNEASRYGLTAQAAGALSLFVYLLADIGINRFPDLLNAAQITKDVAAVVGGAAVFAELLRYSLEGFRQKGEILFPRSGTSMLNSDLLPARVSKVERKLQAATLFFGAASLGVHVVKQAELVQLQQIVQQVPIAATVVQATTAVVGWGAYMFNLVAKARSATKEAATPIFDTVVEGVLATSAATWLVADAFILSTPAAEAAEITKAVATSVFLLAGAVQATKLVVEAVANRPMNCDSESYASLGHSSDV